MEIYVLSDMQPAAMQEWQQAIDGEGFELVLDHSRPFARLSGHLTATWQSKPAGFECDHWPVSDVVRGYPEIDFRGLWKHCLAFRWGADIRACLGGYIAAAAYAKATGGVVFDPQESKVLSPLEARHVACKIREDLPAFEHAMQTFLGSLEAKHHRLS